MNHPNHRTILAWTLALLMVIPGPGVASSDILDTNDPATDFILTLMYTVGAVSWFYINAPNPVITLDQAPDGSQVLGIRTKKKSRIKLIARASDSFQMTTTSSSGDSQPQLIESPATADSLLSVSGPSRALTTIEFTSKPDLLISPDNESQIDHPADTPNDIQITGTAKNQHTKVEYHSSRIKKLLLDPDSSLYNSTMIPGSSDFIVTAFPLEQRNPPNRKKTPEEKQLAIDFDSLSKKREEMVKKFTKAMESLSNSRNTYDAAQLKLAEAEKSVAEIKGELEDLEKNIATITTELNNAIKSGNEEEDQKKEYKKKQKELNKQLQGLRENKPLNPSKASKSSIRKDLSVKRAAKPLLASDSDRSKEYSKKDCELYPNINDLIIARRSAENSVPESSNDDDANSFTEEDDTDDATTLGTICITHQHFEDGPMTCFQITHQHGIEFNSDFETGNSLLTIPGHVTWISPNTDDDAVGTDDANSGTIDLLQTSNEQEQPITQITVPTTDGVIFIDEPDSSGDVLLYVPGQHTWSEHTDAANDAASTESSQEASISGLQTPPAPGGWDPDSDTVRSKPALPKKPVLPPKK